MQSTETPSIASLTQLIITRRTRVEGTRVIIEFSPKLVSMERLCAGVVIRTVGGEIHSYCAIDKRKSESAFGMAGAAIFEIAHALCQSMAKHLTEKNEPQTWKPPFEGASISRISDFTAFSVETEAKQTLERHSTIGTLLSHYIIPEQTRATNIVERVRGMVKRDANAQHLAKRFNRELNLGRNSGTLKVDFLGQNFACYFLQISRSSRQREVNTERALGKLYELETLRKFITRPKKSLGLLDEERPHQFELVMVGNTSDAVQGQIARQVEAMADKKVVRARVLSSDLEAADHVSTQERYAA